MNDPHGLHSHELALGAEICATFFMALRSQTSTEPLRLPKPASRKKRPCGWKLMKLRGARPRSCAGLAFASNRTALAGMSGGGPDGKMVRQGQSSETAAGEPGKAGRAGGRDAQP